MQQVPWYKSPQNAFCFSLFWNYETLVRPSSIQVLLLLFPLSLFRTNQNQPIRARICISLSALMSVIGCWVSPFTGTPRNAQEQVDSSLKFKHCITLLHTINGPHRMKMTIVCVRLLCERLHHYSSKLFERCLVFTRRYLVGAEIQRRVFWWKLAFDSVKTDNKLVGAAALSNADSGWKRGRSREGRAAVSWLASFVLVR